jgi:hypothetical protein
MQQWVNITAKCCIRQAFSDEVCPDLPTRDQTPPGKGGDKRFFHFASTWAGVRSPDAHLAEKIYLDAEKIRLVYDNLSTHSPVAFYEAF